MSLLRVLCESNIHRFHEAKLAYLSYKCIEFCVMKKAYVLIAQILVKDINLALIQAHIPVICSLIPDLNRLSDLKDEVDSYIAFLKMVEF